MSCPAVAKPPQCASCDKNLPPFPSEVGNPINVATREKIQRETDYRSNTLEFTRLYTNTVLSPDIESATLAVWRHNYARTITNYSTTGSLYPLALPRRYAYVSPRGWPDGPPSPGAPNGAFANRQDGSRLYFESSNQGNLWSTDSDTNYSLSSERDGGGNIVSWTLVTPTGDTEVYDNRGLLASLKLKGGAVQTFQYSDASTPAAIAPRPDLLIGVLDGFGRALQFQYDAKGRINTMIDPSGRIYKYAYDAVGNLTDVTFPDGLRKFYHYNEPGLQPVAGYPNYVHYLTGISYEIAPDNVVRYSTYRYDNDGYPISTEHAGGVDKYSFDSGTHTLTDPLGSKRTMLYQSLNGVMLLNSVSQPAGAGSTAATNQSSYDANGNMVSNTDMRGVTTTYTYDMARNLELTRTEASGTPEARKTSTRWHASLRVPESVAQPNLLTDFTYDANANVLTRTVRATADATGALGFSAPVIGTARVWTYAYNAVGQVTQVTVPGTTAPVTTIFTYDTQGNLSTVTNAAGHQTSLTNYNADGKPGRITDPNGLETDLVYDTRGRLASVTTGGESTSYSYDGADQLTRVDMADGSYMRYTYDAAHRLTDLTDSVGNTIHYTLDNMGNRIKEEVKDPGGALARQTTRIYDALSRLQQVTGGAQ